MAWVGIMGLCLPIFAGAFVEEDLDLENAIIIEGIKMDDSGDGEEEFFGEIIYHNDIETEVDSVKPAKQKKSSPVKQAAKIKTPAKSKISFIDELKSEDAKWHLTSYKILKNDNLWKIARRFDTDYKYIIKVNDIKNPSHLLPGKSILVPNRIGCYHNVKQGDTLSGIAVKYGVEPSAIAKANGVKKDIIRLNQKLFIPDGKSVAKAVKSAPEKTPIASVKQKPAVAAAAKKNSETLAAAKSPVETKRAITAATSKATKGKQDKGIDFAWPIKGIKITSGFGTRKDPFDGTRKFHSGIDISAFEGTPVKAACDGVVIFSGWKPGYGNTVIIRHANGYISVYAHNAKTVAIEGANVKKGDVISVSGQTGAVTGPHLHFEIRKYLTPLDPMRFLR